MPCLLGSLLLPWQENEPTLGWPMGTLGSLQGSLVIWTTCARPFSCQDGPETSIHVPCASVMLRAHTLGKCSSQMLPGSADVGNLPLGLLGKVKVPVAFFKFAILQQSMFNATICMPSTWEQIWWLLPVCYGLPFLWLGLPLLDFWQKIYNPSVSIHKMVLVYLKLNVKCEELMDANRDEIHFSPWTCKQFHPTSSGVCHADILLNTLFLFGSICFVHTFCPPKLFMCTHEATQMQLNSKGPCSKWPMCTMYCGSILMGRMSPKGCFL